MFLFPPERASKLQHAVEQPGQENTEHTKKKRYPMSKNKKEAVTRQ